MGETATRDLRFDPDALREKYRLERDKRLRSDGNSQYLEVAGEFARFIEDPYAEPIEREPVFDEVEVAVVGGGFAGLLLGARLREAGVDNLRIIEKGSESYRFRRTLAQRRRKEGEPTTER